MTNLSFVQASFRHRQNLDGTWDSICMRCYLTAAHTLGEQSLTMAESGHRCDETSWLFMEPLGGHSSRSHVSMPSRTPPPSAVPRSRPVEAHPFQQTRRLLTCGLPAGLRMSASAEA